MVWQTLLLIPGFKHSLAGNLFTLGFIDIVWAGDPFHSLDLSNPLGRQSFFSVAYWYPLADNPEVLNHNATVSLLTFPILY